MALIMLADDDKAFCDAVKEYLTSRGHQVVVVHDGAAAALKAQEWRPQLIIMDIQMPGGYGTSAYQVLEREGVTKMTRVIFASGHSLEVVRKLLPADGKSPFLSKPIDFKKLDELITALAPKF